MLPIDAIDKPADTACQHCDQGCSIWDSKPQTCTEFECAYYQAEDIPEALRPDKCGIIFIRRSERIFSGVLVTDVPVTDAAKGQIRSFNEQGFSVVLVSAKDMSLKPIFSKNHDPKEIETEYKEALSGNV